MVLLTIITAEFRRSIGPQIINLLKYWRWNVREAGVEMLLKLSEQGTYPISSGMVLLTCITAGFRETMGTTIPQIIDLLQHNDWYARAAGAKALSKLTEQGRNISGRYGTADEHCSRVPSWAL